MFLKDKYGKKWKLQAAKVLRTGALCVAFTMAQLKRALYDGADLEESVKTGRMNDQMAVELFIMKYSRSEK